LTFRHCLHSQDAKLSQGPGPQGRGEPGKSPPRLLKSLHGGLEDGEDKALEADDEQVRVVKIGVGMGKDEVKWALKSTMNLLTRYKHTLAQYWAQKLTHGSKIDNTVFHGCFLRTDCTQIFLSRFLATWGQQPVLGRK